MDTKTLATAAIAAALGLTTGLTVDEPTISNMIERQEAYFQEHGEYEQIPCRNNALCVHVYDGPQGKGYQIIQDDATARIEMGFGPEAESRTGTWVKPKHTASSTPL